MSVRDDLAWVWLGVEPQWLRSLRRGVSVRVVRVLRPGLGSGPVEELRRVTVQGREALSRRGGARVLLTGVKAGGSPVRRATSWRCPVGHVELSASVPMQVMMCYCGRSMIEVSDNAAGG